MKRGGGKHATIWTWSLVRLQGQCMIEIFYKRTSSSAQGAHNLLEYGVNHHYTHFLYGRKCVGCVKYVCKIKNRRLIYYYYKNTR